MDRKLLLRLAAVFLAAGFLFGGLCDPENQGTLRGRAVGRGCDGLALLARPGDERHLPREKYPRQVVSR